MKLDPKIVEASESRLDFNPEELGKALSGTKPIANATPPIAELRVEHVIAEGQEAARIDLERIFNDSDLMNVNYLQRGFTASEAVCRVQVRDGSGELTGYGTGFLISPRLMLTNHHVLHSAEEAGTSMAEFHYQFSPAGKMMESERYALQPDAFFHTDEALDFTVVAVAEKSVNGKTLTEFGWLQLNPTTGKTAPNECLTIIQHPRGDVKQIAVRENQMLKVQENTLWYRTDTSAGSSGSPVFNDSWQVVALHHSGIPRKDAQGNWLTTNGQIWQQGMDESTIQWEANEGIRVSRIVEALQAAHPDHPLLGTVLQQMESFHPTADLKALVNREREAAMNPTAPIPYREAMAGTPVTDRVLQSQSVRPQSAQVTASGGTATLSPGNTGNGVHLVIPLQVSIQLGDAVVTGGPSLTTAPVLGTALVPSPQEAIVILQDYSDREGYDPAFLGNGNLRVAMPNLSAAMMQTVALNTQVTGANRHVLPYHHYSVIMNKNRRIAYVSAVNIDGSEGIRLKREPDRWIFDPRIPQSAQAGEDLYVNNDFDRGHLTRRLDPAWGTTKQTAKAANDDTFHFSNCSPQHKDFNQGKNLWAGLEDYVLDSTQTEGFKASVFNGPVFRDDDQTYRGIQIPRQFWKVVAAVKTDGSLSATAYLVSQENLIHDLPEEAFIFGAYKTFQVPVVQIEQLTGLDFNQLRSFDPLRPTHPDGTESMRVSNSGSFSEIKGFGDIVL